MCCWSLGEEQNAHIPVCLRSLVGTPALQPHLFLLSLHHLRLLHIEKVIHRDPGLLTTSAGILLCFFHNTDVATPIR